MTDVLARPDEPAPLGPDRTPETRPAPPPGAVALGPLALACLSAAAGIIHLVMAPSHWGESSVEGAGFLVAGWVQLALAVALVRADPPRRPVLAGVAAVDATLIALWAVSRTGLPFAGSHAGHAASVTLVDGTVAAFEAVLVLGSLALLWRPRAASGPRAGGAAALAVPVVVLALTSAVIASPSARDHALGEHGTHGMTEGAQGAGMAGMDHGHDPAAPADDKGLSLLRNGHEHGAAAPVELDGATQARLDDELAVTRTLIARYPTVAVAEAAGYTRVGPYLPGLGAHFIPPNGTYVDGTMEEAELLSPLLVFDGAEPDSHLAGFMYVAVNSATVPEGFAGPNDHWHYHENVCLVPRAAGGFDTPFVADQNVTEAMCTTVGGRWQPLIQHMVHVWVVPGYESPEGLFSDINPALDCPDGTYYQVDWSQMGNRTSACLNP
jgi:hypothetical protein